MRVLVTGGGGYLGSHVTKILTEEKCDVFNVSLHMPNRPLFTDERLYPTDLRDRGHAHLQAIQNVDAVIHLAALINAGESVQKPLAYHASNVWGTIHAMEIAEALGAKKFLFASSAAVYGMQKGQVSRTMDPPRPMNPYGLTKMLGEELVHDWGRRTGVSCASLRIFNMVGCDKGAGVRAGDGGLFGIIAKELRTGMDPRLTCRYQHGEGPGKTPVRDYIHVRDVAQTFCNLVFSDQLMSTYRDATVNVGTGIAVSVREVFQAAQKLFPFEYGSAEAGPDEAPISTCGDLNAYDIHKPKSFGLILVENALREQYNSLGAHL
jgi:UDP-glucose 4-epimerase